MDGLPKYATYFGREMMMTSLRAPVWSDAMAEFVIASALRKLGPQGTSARRALAGGIREIRRSTSNMSDTSRMRRLEIGQPKPWPGARAATEVQKCARTTMRTTSSSCRWVVRVYLESLRTGDSQACILQDS